MNTKNTNPIYRWSVFEFNLVSYMYIHRRFDAVIARWILLFVFIYIHICKWNVATCKSGGARLCIYILLGVGRNGGRSRWHYDRRLYVHDARRNSGARFLYAHRIQKKKKTKKNRLRAPNDYRDGTNKNITGTMRFELQLPSSTFRVSIMFGIMIFRYLCGLFEESYMKGIWLRFIGALDIHIIFHQSSKTIFLM